MKLNVTPANTRDEQGRERFFHYFVKDHMFTESLKNLSDGKNSMILSKVSEPLKQACL